MNARDSAAVRVTSPWISGGTAPGGWIPLPGAIGRPVYFFCIIAVNLSMVACFSTMSLR